MKSSMETLETLSSHLKYRVIDARAFHGLSIKLGFLCSSFLSNNLLHSYVSQQESADARKLFEEIPYPNVVTWSVMISYYAHVGNLKETLLLLKRMQHGNILPTKFTLGSTITGCTRSRDSTTGTQIHCNVIKFGFESDKFVAGTLMDMYGKCGKIDESWKVFDLAPEKNVVSWTIMITNLVTGPGWSQNAAFGLFKEMLSKGDWPVNMTFMSFIKVFDEPRKLSQAKQTHGCMIKLGIEVDDPLRNALIAMYGRCGGIDEVVRLSFRIDTDVQSWTSLLVAYINNGYNVEAIEVFRMMITRKVTIDVFVIATVLGACSELEDKRKGDEIHGYAVRNCFLSDVSVGNSLITLYGRCGEIRKAEKVFHLMDDTDIISWTVILTCYSQNGCGEEALSFFQRMLRVGLSPPIFCVTGAIRACSTIASHPVGTQIHSKTVRMGIDSNLSVENSLITMYAKCGNIDSASRIFNSMTERDIVSWNALITGFSCHGFEKKALELFDEMRRECIQPDSITFIGLLVSCSRVGLVAEGNKYFRMMTEAYELEPQMAHYACMVDLFGRVGMLYKAMEFISSMPYEPDYLIWEALLASCKLHGNIELGKFVAKKVLEMRAEGASPYITLSNIHASMDMWDRKACFRDMMRDHGVQKEPGRSWIESQLCLQEEHDGLQVG